MAAGVMNVVVKNYDQLIKDISSINKNTQKAVSRTIGEFKSRGPGWISQEVTAEYNIKKKDVNETRSVKRGASRIKIAGTKVDDVEIIYRGRLLTPIHFSMKPTVRPKRGPYTVTALIKKSSGRKALGKGLFLKSSAGAGTVQIPFQRRGKERYPIDVFKTVSVPQMVTNKKVSKNINKRIQEELGKRLEHNLKQLVK